MAMNKDDFNGAFRKVISKEYSHIPAENDIDFEFSDKFKNKMDKHINSTKKATWKFINSTAKKVAMIALLIILSTTSVYAVTNTIIKFKNKYQLALEQDTPLEQVDPEGNFVYTKFYEAERETITDKKTGKIVGEKFKDPKIDIFNKMLNTFDYFNEVELTVNLSMTENENLTLIFQTNIDNGYCYEAQIDNKKTIIETFGSPENAYSIRVDHRSKTYGYNMQMFKRSDSPYIPLTKRTVYLSDTDNLPCFVMRKNATNCPMASYSLYPQEMAESYLGNFDLWDIVDTTTYLERDCVVINGSTKPWLSEKHNSSTFSMLVDKETGILMKFEGYKNGMVEKYTTVTTCSIGKTKTDIKKFDLNNYAGYTEGNRNYIPNEDKNK